MGMQLQPDYLVPKQPKFSSGISPAGQQQQLQGSQFDPGQYTPPGINVVDLQHGLATRPIDAAAGYPYFCNVSLSVPTGLLNRAIYFRIQRLSALSVAGQIPVTGAIKFFLQNTLVGQIPVESGAIHHAVDLGNSAGTFAGEHPKSYSVRPYAGCGNASVSENGTWPIGGYGGGAPRTLQFDILTTSANISSIFAPVWGVFPLIIDKVTFVENFVSTGTNAGGEVMVCLLACLSTTPENLRIA